MQTVSVDIGSTWTKAALFAQEGDELTLVNHVLTPTTTHHLAEGFFASLNRVLNVADARPLLHRGDVTLKYSSSAKGGLAVAAMGLVPSITLESAKVTAHSAGAKIAPTRRGPKSPNTTPTNSTATISRRWKPRRRISCYLPAEPTAARRATAWPTPMRWRSQRSTAPLSMPETGIFRTRFRPSLATKI